MRFSRSRRAFTLVEVLVVLAVIALLAALLFSVFTRVQENGRKTVCLSNMRQIMTALSLYTQDSAGQFPPYCVSPDGNFPNHVTSWTNGLSLYLSTPQLLHCPSDELWTQRQELAAMFDPSPAPSSYIANRFCLTWEHAASPPDLLVPFIRPVFERNIVQPSTTVWMCDGAQEASGQAPYTGNSPCSDRDIVSYQWQSGDVLEEPPAGSPTTSERCYAGGYAPDDRHLGRANVAFADGHVKAMNNADWYFPGTPWLDPKRGG